MGRKTVYNDGLVTDEKWNNVSKKNKDLLKDFLDYLKASDKSPATRYQYEQQLKIVLCYLYEYCDNKFFVDLKKRDLIKFSLWLQSDLKVSSSRISTLRSVISSLSAYIEKVLDDEFPDFRNISNVIEISNREPVRDKTIMSQEEMQACLDTLVKEKRYQIACYFALLVSSGMRKSEAIQMKTSFFEEKNKVLNGVFYLTPFIRTKGKGERGKPLQKYIAVKIFQPYLDLWLEERKEKGIKSEYLFITYKDGNYVPAAVSTVNSWANTIGKITKLDYYNHSSRHFFTTYMKENGFSDTDIQGLVGWASLDMVRRYDDHTNEQQLEQSLDKFKAVFGAENDEEDQKGNIKDD